MTNVEEQDFAAASTAEKQRILLDPNVSSAKVLEYLSLCGTMSCKDLCSEEVEKKIEPHCNDECKRRKEKTDNDLFETETNITKMYDKAIKKKKDEIVWLEKSAKVCSILSEASLELRQQTYDPEKHERILHKKINTAVRDGMLEPSIGEDLKKKTSSALEIDASAPAGSDPNSVKTSYDSVHKAIRLRQGVCKEEEKGMRKAKAKTIHYVKAMSRETTYTSMNADAASKTLGATSSILSSVASFQEAEEEKDDGKKAVKIIGGCLHAANGISQFMGPPASLVTETALGIFGIVTGGPPDPSNQQVIDEVKNAINKGFAHQRNFLEKKFAEHMNLIRVEFAKLENVISKQFSQLGENIAEGFAAQRNFISQKFTEDHLRKVKNEALAQLEAIEEKKLFIDKYKNGDINDVALAQSIDRQIAALSNTRYSSLSKTTFEDICPAILDEKYPVSKTVTRKYCATLLYTYLMVEQDRNFVLFELTQVLARTSLRRLEDGFLNVLSHRKSEVQGFIKDVVLEKKVGCSLFNPQSGPPVLTDKQTTEITTYIKYLNEDTFSGSIDSFKNRTDCPSKYLQT